MNEVIKSLFTRRSVRAYTEEPVTQEEKEAILAAAFQAPTAGCQQLYTVIDVTDQREKEELAELCDHQPFIAKAPVVLIFCADCKRWLDAYREAGVEARAPGMGDALLAMADACIAAQNAVTAAESLGLGSCYIGDILENQEWARELLRLPEYVFPACMLVLGRPTRQQRERPKPERLEKRYVVFENTYRPLTGEELRAAFRERAGERGFEEWMRAFCLRKYASDFSLEMTRSVQKWMEMFQKGEARQAGGGPG